MSTGGSVAQSNIIIGSPARPSRAHPTASPPPQILKMTHRFSPEDDDGHSAADMHNNAINTARGSLNEALGDLLVFDADGQRTELVRPHLDELASDPVLFVRTSVAHTLSAALRHARPDAVAAFHRLIDADDRISAAASVSDLMIFIGNVEPMIVEPTHSANA